MSPLGIEIMLHYHTRCNDWADEHPGQADAPVVRSMISNLVREDMLIGPSCSVDAARKYSLTERGKAYVNFLREMPFPVAIATTKWEMPK